MKYQVRTGTEKKKQKKRRSQNNPLKIKTWLAEKHERKTYCTTIYQIIGGITRVKPSRPAERVEPWDHFTMTHARQLQIFNENRTTFNIRCELSPWKREKGGACFLFPWKDVVSF